ncbi:hypothetical protein Tco_1553693 [Tanacetum coccineum]
MEQCSKGESPLTHPHPKRNFVLTAVATKSGLVPVNAAKQSSPRAATSISTARKVNTAASKPKVNAASPTKYSYFKAHSPLRRPFNQKSAAKTNNIKEEVYTAKVNKVTTAGPEVVVSTAEGKSENVVKSSACWIWRPTGKVIDHISKDSGSYMPKRFGYVDPQGRLKHMTGNKSYLTDYQDIDGGFIAFAGSPKRGKITGKCKIRTGKLDFEDVYFVKELKFNLFSVSQLCDKKNNVLFNETECLILSPDFKLLDESQVLLKVPRHDTMTTSSTPIETPKAIVKDEEAENVDVHLYQSMIRSLMYLTASRPDIMFAVCTCARFQVTPKVSHLHAVKMIFIYLKVNTVEAYLNAARFQLMRRETRKGFSGKVTPLFATMMVQATEDIESIPDEAIIEEHVATPSCDPPQSGEDRMQLTELRDLLKSMEKRRKSKKPGLRGLRDRLVQFAEEKEVAKKEVSVADPVTTAGKVVTTANVEFTTANGSKQQPIDVLTLARDSIEIKHLNPKLLQSSATTTTPTRTKARGVAKDKGKAKMVEPEKPLKKKDQMPWMKKYTRNLKLNYNLNRKKKDDDFKTKNIDRENLETLWKLVKAKHGNTRPDSDKADKGTMKCLNTSTYSDGRPFNEETTDSEDEHQQTADGLLQLRMDYADRDENKD